MRRRRRAPDARTVVLTRIRAALDAGGRTAPTPVRAYRRAGTQAPGSDVLIEMLAERLVDYRAAVQVVDGEEALLAAIVATLRNAGVGTVVVPPWLPASWITAAAGAGVRVLTDSPSGPLDPVALDRVGAVLTAARVAIAETGTIVLDSEGDQGRRAITLVPDRHVCIVRAGQVVQTVPDAVTILRRAPARPLTWISGPSATSDIELSRVEGVHGPRTLQVILAR